MNPHTYILELTNNCNESCDFCYSTSYDASTKSARVNTQLSGKEWKQVLDNIVANGARSIDFSGGEPTLHPQFREVLKHAHDAGLETIVSTNGSTIRNERTRSSLSQYADWVSLSMHGIEDVHDNIKHRPGSYDRVMQAYGQLLESETKVKVNSVVCQDNIDSIVDLGYALDIDNSDAQWKLSQVCQRECGYDSNVQISNEDFAQIKKEVSKRYSKAFDEGRITFRDDDSQQEFSFAPYVIVSSDGSVKVPVGNGHKPLGVNLTNAKYIGPMLERMQMLGDGFVEEVKENHEKFYSTSDVCNCLMYQLYRHGVF